MLIIIEKYCFVKQFAKTTNNELLKFNVWGECKKKLTADFGPTSLAFDLSFRT